VARQQRTSPLWISVCSSYSFISESVGRSLSSSGRAAAQPWNSLRRQAMCASKRRTGPTYIKGQPHERLVQGNTATFSHKPAIAQRTMLTRTKQHWTTGNMSQQTRSLSSITTFPVGAKSATNRVQQGSSNLGLSCTVACAFGNLLSFEQREGETSVWSDVGAKHQLAQLTRAA
jgi:hypothetical protein